jgi:prevent-host-death family protein
MERISTSKARKDFRNVIRRASSEGKRVKITHYGKTLVGLVSAKDLEKLQDCETDPPRRPAKRSARRR